MQLWPDSLVFERALCGLSINYTGLLYAMKTLEGVPFWKPMVGFAYGIKTLRLVRRKLYYR